MITKAIAGVDIAVWGVKAQALGIPLYQALGAVRCSVRGYASGGWAPGVGQSEMQDQDGLVFNFGGFGGDGPLSGGIINSGTTGSPGRAPGSGASGAGSGSSGTTAYPGAAGAAGLCIVWW